MLTWAAIIVIIIAHTIRIFNMKEEPVNIAENDDFKTNHPENIPSPFDQMKTILKNLGFILDEHEYGISFSFERINMTILNNNDPYFIGIIIPGIMDIVDYEEIIIYRIADQINGELRNVKACVVNDSLCLTYERELHLDEIIEEGLVESMIYSLARAYIKIDKNYKKINESGI